MIRISVLQAGRPPKTVNWDQPILTIGRAPANDVQIQADNVSSLHARILLEDGTYVLRDNRSTNGTIVERDEKRYLLRGETLEMELAAGDRIGLASFDHMIVVDAIELELTDDDDDDDRYEQTILAEQQGGDTDFETQLGQDFEALQCTVRMARELVGKETLNEIAQLMCTTCLRAFPRSRSVMMLVPRESSFAVECLLTRNGQTQAEAPSTVLQSRRLLDRCLAERKGFLFIIEQNQMQAVATMIGNMESSDGLGSGQDRVILCCPLFHQDRCYGFIEVEAPLTPTDRHTLTRRDLQLATLMSHLISARLNDIEQQRMRLKLARKATAGFVSAMVGHCFKNLLFVPMSISKMLPLCLKSGKMEEVDWMLARNGVNIRYLDILSNEFAAASKDPTEGFEPTDIAKLVTEVAELVNQIAPDKLEAKLLVQPSLPEVVAHGAALKRLFMNLTLNAVDALFGMNRPAGEKGVIELKAAVDPSGEWLGLVVQDNGPGIPDDIIENLREIFKQVQSSADALSELQSIAERVRSTKEQGFKEHYGLGFLFVCQTVMHHHGDLELDNVPGQGARFIIRIPTHRDLNATHDADA